MKVRLLKKLRKHLRLAQFKSFWMLEEKKSLDGYALWRGIKMGPFSECLNALHSKMRQRLKDYLNHPFRKKYKQIIKF